MKSVTFTATIERERYVILAVLLAAPATEARGSRAAQGHARVPGSYVEARGTARCSIDCSGHEAGWRWAARRHISNPDLCTGNSRSFIEGCRAYAEDVGL